MAITKTIEIDVDEVKAVGGLENLDKALQESDKQTKSLKTQIREATAELIRAQEEFGDYSAAALDAAKKVALLKDKVQEAKETSDLYDPGARFAVATNAIAAGANAIQTYQAALGLVGVEGEAAEETLLKVQSAMAFSQGLSQIADSGKEFRRLAAEAQKFTIVQKAITAGQWLWNAAQAANPIGAIVAAVVALIAAGVALTKYFMDNSAAAEANAKSIKESKIALENQSKTLEINSTALDKKQKQELAMAKASGMSAEAIRKLELKLADEKIAYEKSQRAIAMNTYEKEQNILATMRASGASEEDIKKQTALRNESVKQYNKQNQVVGKALEERKDIENRHLVEVKTAEVASAKDNEKRRKEQRDKAKEELKKQYEDAKKIADDARVQNENAGKTELEILEDKFKKEKAILEKNKIETNELELKYLNERNNILLKQQDEEKKVRDKNKEQQEKEAEEKRLKDQEKLYKDLELKKELDNLTFDEQRALITERENTLLNDKTLSEEQRTELEKQYAEARKTIAQKEAEAKEKNLQAISNLLGNAANVLGESTAAGKAAAVAQATISTYQSAVQSYNSLSGIPVVGPALGTVAAGVAVASGLMNVKKILSVKTPGGKGGGGSVPSGGGAPSMPTTAPTFNTVGNAGVNQIQNRLGTQQPIQAYVVANDVTTQQGLDRNIVRNASLG
jgi:hypothetical protein